MKAAIMASDGNILCQGSALREGFAALGHEHTFEVNHPDTAFIFVGNSPYEPYLDLAKSRDKKVIFNVLDLPFWTARWPEYLALWREQLPLAAKVTCISKTVQAQLKEHLNVDAEVIYYPSKKVTPTGVKKYPKFKVALVGRVSDPSKRAGLAVQALVRAGFNEDEVAVVGPEWLGYGTRMGVVSDEVLNDIYNSVDYVMMMSRWEGLGLPALEAAMAGAIPIVAPDLSTFNEFWADSPLGLHYQLLNSPDSIAKLIREIEAKPEWKAQIKQDMLAYAHQFFRPKFDRVAVASRIINVFHSI